MTFEFSCGIVPLRKVKGEWQVLLIQHGSAGYWGFPKGHGEPGESAVETAIRELQEETNLTIKKFLSEAKLETHYFFSKQGKTIRKTVFFFVAEVKGKLQLQVSELSGARWVPLETAEEHITYETDKSIFRQAIAQSMEGRA